MQYCDTYVGQRVKVVPTYYNKPLRNKSGIIRRRGGGNVRVHFNPNNRYDWIDIKPFNLVPDGLLIRSDVSIEDVI